MEITHRVIEIYQILFRKTFFPKRSLIQFSADKHHSCVFTIYRLVLINRCQPCGDKLVPIPPGVGADISKRLAIFDQG